MYLYAYVPIIRVFFCFCYRSETVHQQRTRSSRLLLCSVDSEDGIGMVDDDMEALLPNNRGLSDELSHVSTYIIYLISDNITSK